MLMDMVDRPDESSENISVDQLLLPGLMGQIIQGSNQVTHIMITNGTITYVPMMVQ